VAGVACRLERAVGQFPDAAVYGAMSEQHCDGVIRRVTNERDAKWENKK
jgi:hypothetical protein